MNAVLFIYLFIHVLMFSNPTLTIKLWNIIFEKSKSKSIKIVHE